MIFFYPGGNEACKSKSNTANFFASELFHDFHIDITLTAKQRGILQMVSLEKLTVDSLPSHLSPLYPNGQMHLNSVTTAVQVPPFLHGLTPQGSITARVMGSMLLWQSSLSFIRNLITASLKVCVSQSNALFLGSVYTFSNSLLCFC